MPALISLSIISKTEDFLGETIESNYFQNIATRVADLNI